MYLRTLALVLCLLPGLHGSESDELILAADRAQTNQDSRGALELLLRADAIKPDDALILQKIARQYSDLVVEQSTNAGKKHYAETALAFSERAVALSPQDPVNILSLAVCHGKLALSSDSKDKVRYSRLVHDEAVRALSLAPNYAWAHHVLGRWHCEMAAFGPTARFFAKFFYGELLPASFTEGIRELQRATELEPDELTHWLELGFAHFAAGDSAGARRAWKRGLALPSRGTHDELDKQRVRAALARLN